MEDVEKISLRLGDCPLSSSTEVREVIAELVVELAEVEAVGAGSGVEVGAEH